MKTSTVLMLLTLALACGCKDKTYTCQHSYYHVPLNVYFVGFTIPELDTVIVSEYAPGAGFSVPTKTYSLIHANIILRGDTASGVSGQPFALVQDGTDYELRIPVTGGRYRLTRIHYPPDGPATEELPYQCHEGTVFYGPDSVLVNGQQAGLMENSVYYSRNVFLVK